MKRKDELLKRVLKVFGTAIARDPDEADALLKDIRFALLKDIRFALYPIRFEQGVVAVSNKPENQK